VVHLGLLDNAVSSVRARKQWLNLLKSVISKAIDGWHHSHSSIKWVIMRDIHVTQILVNLKHRSEISDITFEDVNVNGSQTSCDEAAKVVSTFLTWDEPKYLVSIDLSGCRRITDIGLSALGHGCAQQKNDQSLFLRGHHRQRSISTR
jgi:hypothetical protein